MGLSSLARSLSLSRSLALDDQDYGAREASSNEGRAIPSGILLAGESTGNTVNIECFHLRSGNNFSLISSCVGRQDWSSCPHYWQLRLSE